MTVQRPQPAARPSGQSGWWHPKLLGFAVIVLLLAVFISQNFDSVGIRFLVGEFQTRLAWALLIAAGLGFAAGLLLPRLRRGGKQ